MAEKRAAHLYLLSMFVPEGVDESTPDRQAFNTEVAELFANHKTMEMATSIPPGKLRVFADPDTGRPICIVERGVIYRPDDHPQGRQLMPGGSVLR